MESGREMSEMLLVNRKLHEQFIPAMKWWQGEVEQWRSGILPSPEEEAMLRGDAAQDEATVMRMLLECLIRQHLADTIATAQQIVGLHAKRNK